MEQHKLLVGFDLCNDYSQLACYNYNIFEPESVGEEADEYLIPTVLGVTHDTKDWIYGKDAIRQEKLGKAYLLENFIEKIVNQEEIIIHEVSFSAEIILERFIRKCLLLIKKRYPTQNIDHITITVREQSIWFIQAIYRGLESLGIEKDRSFIISREHSFVYYTLYQNKEIWRNDVGLFDFSKKGMFYSHLAINHRTSPILAETKEQDYSQLLEYEMIQEQDNAQTNFILEEVVKSALHKKIVSTLYLTGKGFQGEWADDTIARLCQNRRVFKGQNIYAAGACYAAREWVDKKVQEEFLILCEGIVRWNILIQVYSNADMKDMPLAKVGLPWYESTNRVDVILDDLFEIQVVIRDIIDGEESLHKIFLGDMKEIGNKTMRLAIEGRFLEPRKCVITVRDLGFGDIFPSSNRIWEKKIEL